MSVKAQVTAKLPVSKQHGTMQNNGSEDAFQTSAQAGSNSLINYRPIIVHTSVPQSVETVPLRVPSNLSKMP
jgi:hypothetical protein